MKKTFCVLLLVVCVSTTYGQILSLKDLIKINEMSFDKFHPYATSRKYKLYEMQDDQKVESFTYAFGQNHSNLYATRVVTKHEYKDSKKRMVSYQTLTSGDYYHISNQVSTKGLPITNKGIKSVGTAKSQMYQLGKNQITLTTDQGYDHNGAKIIYYQVLVTTVD